MNDAPTTPTPEEELETVVDELPVLEPALEEDDELGPLDDLTEELTNDGRLTDDELDEMSDVFPVTPEEEAAIDAALIEDPIETQTFAPLDEIAGSIPADEDGYLDTETALVQDEAVTGTVVVMDFDPADPGAPIAEPQKVLKPHDRIQRKRDRGSRE